MNPFNLLDSAMEQQRNNKWSDRRTKGSCKSDSWPNKQFLSILQHRRAERISVWARFHESESQPSVPEPAFFSYWFSPSFPIPSASVSASLSDTFSNKDAARRRRCKITTWSEPLERSPHPPRYSSESRHAATASRGEFLDYSKFFLRDGLHRAVASNWGLTSDDGAKPDMLMPVFPWVKRQTVWMIREIGSISFGRLQESSVCEILCYNGYRSLIVIEFICLQNQIDTE